MVGYNLEWIFYFTVGMPLIDARPHSPGCTERVELHHPSSNGGYLRLWKQGTLAWAYMDTCVAAG